MNKTAHPPLIPLSAATVGIAIFVGMDTLMKSLSIEMGAYNALFWRTLIGASLAAVPFLLLRMRWPRPEVLKLHLWRGSIVSVMAFLFFWGLIYVPMAEAIALSFIAPLLALYLAAIMLGERVGATAVMASLMGLAGAIVVIAGKLSGDFSENAGKGIAAILLSALMYAYNLILQRRQALVAEPLEIALFQNGVVAGIYLFLSPFLAIVPPAELMPTLVAAALCGIVSVLLISWAYRRAEARILIPVEYTAFVWAALMGWLVFAEEVTLATLVGTALIVGGCLLVARQKPTQVDHVETTAV